MTPGILARALPIALVALLLGGGIARADTYTARFTGFGSSDFGFALMYARMDAKAQAESDGFTDPDTQCVEIETLAGAYVAFVTWECTR